MEGMFHAYVAWMVLKAIFWLWMVGKMLPGSAIWSYRFRPLLQDPRKHFGLFALHKPYNFILLLMLIGAFVMALTFASNVAKEVSGDFSVELNSHMGTILIAVAVFIPGIAMFFGPMIYFDHRMSKVKQKLLTKMDRHLAGCLDRQRVIAIETEKETVAAQTCWPHENKQFKALAIAIGIFVAMPVLLSLHQVPKEVEAYLSAVKQCQTLMRALSDHIYHLTKSTNDMRP